MIRGRINKYGEPCVSIALAGSMIEVVVDTGFNGALWLPKTLVASLDLEILSTQKFAVADGHVVESQVLAGRITWFGKEIEVEIIPTESDNALLGTALLQQCSLLIHFPQKLVEIRSTRKTSALKAV